MVRNNVLSTVELVCVNEDKGCDQRVSICFSIPSSQGSFINLLIEVPVWNDLRELYVESCSQLFMVQIVKGMFIIHY